jgi:hypothetical protein
LKPISELTRLGVGMGDMPGDSDARLITRGEGDTITIPADAGRC